MPGWEEKLKTTAGSLYWVWPVNGRLRVSIASPQQAIFHIALIAGREEDSELHSMLGQKPYTVASAAI